MPTCRPAPCPPRHRQAELAGGVPNGLPSPRVPSGCRSPLALPPPALTPSGSFVHQPGSFFGSLAPQPSFGAPGGSPRASAAGGGGGGMSRHASAARLAELVSNPMAGCDAPQAAPELAAPGAGAELAAAAALQLPAAPPPLTPAHSGSLPRLGLGLGLGLPSAALVPASPRVGSGISMPGSAAATPRAQGLLLSRFGSVEMGLSALGEPGAASAGGGAAPLLARDSEAIAQRLAHAFPWNKAGQVRPCPPATRAPARAFPRPQPRRSAPACRPPRGGPAALILLSV
jgi:hypothetical protein